MENNTIKTYKGFDKDMTCQEFRYEEGKEYEHDGDVRACESGFHACENPMDILGYYPPCDNKGNLQRYCEVKQSGTLDRSENDKSMLFSAPCCRRNRPKRFDKSRRPIHFR